MARETGTLLAGNICNTNVFAPDDAEPRARSRAMFEEQVGWAVEAGVDFIIGETFSWGEEALIALEVIKQTGLPAVITLAIHQRAGDARGLDARRRPASASRTPAPTSSASTASAARARCCPLIEEIREAVEVPRRGAAGALPHDARPSRASSR